MKNFKLVYAENIIFLKEKLLCIHKLFFFQSFKVAHGLTACEKKYTKNLST